MEMLSVDYSLPIGLSGVGIALAYHLEHSTQSNQIHLTFALSVRCWSEDCLSLNKARCEFKFDK